MIPEAERLLRENRRRRGDGQAMAEAAWGRRNTAGVAIASSLVFDSICLTIGDTSVLDNVTIEVEPGEVLCLLGPSGSGKTTLMRIAAGLTDPDSGAVWIDQRVVTADGVNVPPEKRGIGLVFQDYALFPHMTILDNVLFGLKDYPRDMARDEALRMLGRVGLESRTGDYPHQLSGGEQQRVALARSLAPRPGILLMDEPFSGLDARLRDTVREETIGLLRDTRSTAVIVTHDPEEALRAGDHIALMRNGRLVQLGTAEDLYYRPANLFAASFFSEINLLQGRVKDGHVDTPLGPLPAPDAAPGAQVAISIRLADVHVRQVSDRREAGIGVTARIISRRFVGVADIVELYIDGLDHPLRARVKAGEVPDSARDVRVTIAEGTAMVFPVEEQA